MLSRCSRVAFGFEFGVEFECECDFEVGFHFHVNRVGWRVCLSLSRAERVFVVWRLI